MEVFLLTGLLQSAVDSPEGSCEMFHTVLIMARFTAVPGTQFKGRWLQQVTVRLD